MISREAFDSHIDTIWQQLVLATSKRIPDPATFRELLEKFAAAPGHLEYVREGLVKYDVWTPLIVKELSNKDKIELLPEILERLKSWHGQTDTLQEAIASMPCEQLISPLEIALEPYFQDMEELAVTELLILCQMIDPDLTRKFATRAYHSTDRGVSEVGGDNLALLRDRKTEDNADAPGVDK